MLANPIKELIVEKKFLNLFFFGILFLDALGTVFNESLNRQITILLPMPLIIIIFLVNAKKINILFLTSLVFQFLGIFYFNNIYTEYNSFGLIWHALAYIIYFVIVFKNFNLINISLFLKFSVLTLLLVIIPVIFYTKGILKMDIFNETMIYVFAAVTFIVTAFLSFVNNKTKTNKLLLFSGIFLLLNSYCEANNLFMNYSSLLQFFSIIFFNLTQYFMCMYIIKKQKKEII